MCLPALAIGMTLFKGVMEYKQQKQQAKMATAQQDAQIQQAKMQKATEIRNLELQGEQYAREKKRMLGMLNLQQAENKVSAGATGIDSDYGSVLDVQKLNQENFAEDYNVLSKNEFVDANNKFTNIKSAENQIKQSELAKKNIRKNLKWARIGTILNTAVSAYSGFKGMSKAQPTGATSKATAGATAGGQSYNMNNYQKYSFNDYKSANRG